MQDLKNRVYWLDYCVVLKSQGIRMGKCDAVISPKREVTMDLVNSVVSSCYGFSVFLGGEGSYGETVGYI